MSENIKNTSIPNEPPPSYTPYPDQYQSRSGMRLNNLIIILLKKMHENYLICLLLFK